MTDDNKTKIQERHFPTPSEFMRGRRPEQYSDSKIEQIAELDRDTLEYKLASLTSRSEEKQFEHLARKLAEKLICPNLIPQTGPTGGGDSKVDTETYPVHEDISLLWYEGNVNAANERWGFAVSAKKQWQGKLRSDMTSIASTGRGYKIAYFISNQFISDKIKSKWQDELTKEHDFEVRILDRTWLLEAIIDKGNEGIAVQTLNLSSFSPQISAGPNDYARNQALEELEGQISDSDRYKGVEYQLVEDCLSAAIISRELEISRDMTDGRHERAIRVAKKHGSASQIASALYQKAWTAVYWHNDFDVLLEVYDNVEGFSLGSRDTSDIEKTINLWQSLHSAVLTQVKSVKETCLVERAKKLTDHLDNLSKDKDRPNNAANSKALLIGLLLVQNAANEGKRARLLKEFGDLMVNSQHLGSFEFDRQYEYFEVLEDAFGELEEYDAVFEQLLPIVEKRKSDTVVADKFFNRGISKLRNEHIHEAIDLLGRALPKLIKAEKKERMVRCLGALAAAYSSVDLFWAAYANLMSAISILIQDFGQTREIDPVLPMLLGRMFWGEVSVGRIPHALWALELQTSILRQMGLAEEELAKVEDDLRVKDGVLAMLLLKADQTQIAEFRGLVDFLEESGLVACPLALLFAFGGPEYLRQNEYVPKTESDEDIWDTMKMLWDQPAQEDLPERIETFGGNVVQLVSQLLGIHWEVTCENNPWCVRIGESYLAFMEAFLATSLAHDAFGTMERACIDFKLAQPNETCPNDQGLEMQTGQGSVLATITIWPEKFPIGSLKTDKMRDFFVYSLVNILPRILFPKDTETFLETVAGEEEGLPRALMFADVFISASNLFDDCKSPSLSDWYQDDKEYDIVADPPCNLALQSIMALRSQKGKEEKKFGEGEPPEELLDTTALRHGKQRILSMVDIELWGKAQWDGVGIAVTPDFAAQPPFLGLLFKDGKAGRQIFENWILELGQVDTKEKIRVVILTGVEKANANAYTLGISSNFDLAEAKELDRVLITSKMKTMEDPNPENLANFRRAYAAAKKYSLVPVSMSKDGAPPEFHFDLAITKNEINIREAWTVGMNDPDCMAITGDINPIIPDGEENAPILDVIKFQQSRK